MEISELPEMFKKQGMITEEKIDAFKIALYINVNFNIGKTVDINNFAEHKLAWFIANEKNYLYNFKDFKDDIINMLRYICEINNCKDTLNQDKINKIFSHLSILTKTYNKIEFRKKYTGYNRHLMPM